jgi:DNA-binding transcriptional MerR regulator
MAEVAGNTGVNAHTLRYYGRHSFARRGHRRFTGHDIDPGASLVDYARRPSQE